MHPLTQPLATDRDLLVLEPLLFRHATIASQRLIDGITISIAAPASRGAGSVISAASADWSDLGLQPGDIAQLNLGTAGVIFTEIVDVTNAASGELTISRLRADVAASDPFAPRLGLSAAATATLTVDSFAPQRAAAHASLLASFNLPHSLDDPGAPVPTEIANARELWLVAACHTLALIYTSLPAIALSPASPINNLDRAEQYHRRASTLRANLSIWLRWSDNQTTRHQENLNTTTLTRA